MSEKYTDFIISSILYVRQYVAVQRVICNLKFIEMAQAIEQYLKQPFKNPRPPGDQDPQFAYLITYIGQLFVQGYRLVENYGSILLFSLMQFQFSDSSHGRTRRLKKLPPRFKLVLWLKRCSQIHDDGTNRRKLFDQMTLIGSLLQEVQFHIVYLHQRKYSIVPMMMLQKNELPSCFNYFKKNQWIEQKNGLRPISEKEEGIQLHRLVQSFIKGAGEGRNPDLTRRIQGQNKFVYDLFKVINTVCYIVGKEILQNDFQTISVQKWMRKHTQKKFKRFDLLMRGAHKCSIIDWKFTRLDAEQKIKGASTHRKNQTYYQLARKDFKTQIQLKFYCFHQRSVNQSYHCFTTARFNYQITTVDIEQQEKKEKEKKNKDETFDQIVIQDSLIDLIPDVPEGQIACRSPPIIKLDSSDEEVNKKIAEKSIVLGRQVKNNENNPNNYKSLRINERLDKNLQYLQIEESPPLSQQLITNKQRIKNEKRLFKQKSNFIRFPIQVYEIDSD